MAPFSAPTVLALLLVLLLASILPWPSSSTSVTLSNVALPVDTAGTALLSGEISVLALNGSYVLTVNDWGDCVPVDCCGSSGGCASCCFSPPSKQYPDACVYAANHSFAAYSTRDFAHFTPLGSVLPESAHRPGIMFRPHMVYHAASERYLLWYEDRWSNGSTNPGYAIAAAASPAGPFAAVTDSLRLAGTGRVGDYDLFIDDDLTAYHIRTGIVIERLDASWTAGTGQYYELALPDVEGPAMFKRQGVYYVMVGVGCCACRGGSNVLVYRSKAPLGPYGLQGDVGSNATQPFDKHSPYNYVTHAQLSGVVRVLGEGGLEQFVWVGSQWVTGPRRNADLLYFAVLDFDSDGNVKQLQWQDKVNFTVMATDDLERRPQSVSVQ